MFDPCLSPLRSLYYPPPPGFGFYCFSQHRSGNQTQRFAAGSKGLERCRGGINGKGPRHVSRHCCRAPVLPPPAPQKPRHQLRKLLPGWAQGRTWHSRGFGTAVRGGSISKMPLLPQQVPSSTRLSVEGEGHCPPGRARGSSSHVISSDSSFDPDLPISRGVHRALHKHGGDARRRNL